MATYRRLITHNAKSPRKKERNKNTIRDNTLKVTLAIFLRRFGES